MKFKYNDIFRRNRRQLTDVYYVKRMGIFGSAARGRETKRSDIDILVEFSRPVGFLKFIELENFLSRKFGKKVDLVTKKALKPAIKKSILKEVIYAE